MSDFYVECEHKDVCKWCDELNVQDCNFYVPKVDREWVVSITQNMVSEKEWESKKDYENAYSFAQNIVSALGLNSYQVFDNNFN